MQVSNINNNIINIKSNQQSSPFKSGTQIKATVAQVNGDGTVIMESSFGTFTATNTTGVGLNPGDSISLLVTNSSQDGNAATTTLTQVNGQPIDQNVSLSELHLIDLGVLPNSANLRLYDIINRFQLPLTKEVLANLRNVFESLPGITDEQAAFLAASGIEPTLENLNALTGIGTLHEDVASLLADSMAQIVTEYGISESAFADIVSTLGEGIESALNNPSTLEQTELSQAIPSATLEQVAPEQSGEQAATLEQIATPEQLVSDKLVQPSGQGIPSGETIQEPPTLENTPPSILSPSGETVQPKIDNSGTQLLQFIPNKAESAALLTNYLNSAVEVPQDQSEAIAQLLPNVIESMAESIVDKLSSQDAVTLKTISDLKLPESFPKELQQIISALPKDVQAQLDLLMPKVLQSAKEFLSVMLIRHAGDSLQVKVAPETTGDTLKQNVKSMSENLASVLTDKAGASAQKTVTSLKLSDNTMSFLQIPITINEHKTTAEMFVVQRDSRKKLSLEDGIKMVFALNTENLGRIESIISANTKDLSLNIRVESKATKTALEAEISYLRALLSGTNFYLSTLKVTLIDKKTTVLNAHTHFGYKQLDITI